MYKVYCNDVLIHDGSSPSKEIKLINPSLKLGDNIAGSFSFVAPPGHVAYNLCNLMQDTITIKQDDLIIWKGRPISESRDFWNNRKVNCEGALAFLNDTTQDLNFYEAYDPTRFLMLLISTHNEKVGEPRKIMLGTTDVVDENTDYVYETNYKSTYEELKTNLLDRLGGHLRIRYRQTDGMPILDYLSDYLDEATQEINFGHNLMEFTRNWDLSHLCTAILPKGGEIKKEVETTQSTSTDSTESAEPVEEEHEQKEYVTIESVNNGSKYLINVDAYHTYGRIERTVEFSDCETPQLLLELGTAYITAMQFDDMTLEVNAIDLHFLDPSIEGFQLLEQVQCISLPHGMDRYFPITEIDIALDHPENTKYTLNGSGSTMSMTSSNISTAANIDKAMRKTTSVNNIVNSALTKVNALLVDYAHITEGVIDNAKIDQADVNNLNANYAHISEGVIDNAKIDYADVNELSSHYAHINNGVIDNARIDSAYIDDLQNRFAHINNGIIDNAQINYADVKDLNTNYAHITEGYIDNAMIGHANVGGLEANYAHITDGKIDNAKIGYANITELDTHYSKADFSNVENSWIEAGVIKDGAIKSAMIESLSASKLAAGTIDASGINVLNLNANNITTGTLNGVRLAEGTVDLDRLSESVYSQDAIDGMFQTVYNRIDSAIETYTGTSVPTMVTYPASDWTTDDVKSTHVGDIYYVVNPNIAEDGYGYRFSEINGTFSWELIRDSDVTATLAEINTIKGQITTINQFNSDVATWRTNMDGNVSTLTMAHTTLSASVNKTVKNITQLWYTKDTTSLPSAPSEHVTNDGVGPGAWTKSVPVYDPENPNYFYCYEYEYVDGTYQVSDPVFDRAMSEAQQDADGGIIASYQLWTVGPTTDVPDGPTSIGGPYSILHLLDKDILLDSDMRPIQDKQNTDYTVNIVSDEYRDYLSKGNYEYIHDSSGLTVDDTESDPYLTGLRWTIEVPAYDVNNPNYFYCWEYHHLDGTVTWSEGVFDKATTDAQKKTEIIGEQLDYKVDVNTFNELKHLTDENSATITRMSQVITDNETTTTNSINSIIQTATGTTNKITKMINRLGFDEEGNPTEEDIVAQQSILVNDIDLFKQTIRETYYTKAEADNLVIGGRNLLRMTREFLSTTLSDEFGDSIFDSSTRNILTSRSENGYLNNAESTLTFDTYRDLRIRQLNRVGQSSSDFRIFAEYVNVIIPEIGSSYVLSFYAKGATKIAAYFTNGVDSETIKTDTSLGDEVEPDNSGFVELTINSIWSRYWVRWTVGGSATNTYRSVILKVFGGNIAYVCGMKFEEGTKATAWTPAPEDNDENTQEAIREYTNAIAEKVTQAQTDIIKTSEYIGLKADKAETYTITDVNGIISQEVSDRNAAISLSAGQIESAVANTYATINTVNGLESRVGSAETRITQTESSIALKADSSTTYTKTDVNGLIATEISNRNSAIEVSDRAIRLSVKENYTSKLEFNGMTSGGRNLLMFTKDFDDTFMSDSNGRAITDSRGVSFGEEQDRYLVNGEAVLTGEHLNEFAIRSLDCSSLAASSHKEAVRYKNVIAPVPGNSYIFSFYAKGSGKITAYFYPNPSGGSCSAVTSQHVTVDIEGETVEQNVSSDRSDGCVYFTIDSTWTRYWVKWTIGGTNASGAKRHVLLRVFGGNSVNICGLKFEEGTVISAWTPAIEDSGLTLEQYKEELERKIEENAESTTQLRADFGVTTTGLRSEVARKTDKGEIISVINQSPELIQIAASKVDIAGATIFSDYVKTTEAFTDGQYIYISKPDGTMSVPKNFVWVEDETGGQNKWTTVRPEYTKSYPILFVAKQKLKGDGTADCTTPKRDSTTTVIDGGHIMTGTITANEIDTAHIKIISLEEANTYTKRSHYIYHSSASVTSSVATPSTWVTDVSGNQNTWTTKRPKYHPSYPKMWITLQQETANGNLMCDPPVVDDTTTGYSTTDNTVQDSQYIYISKPSGTGNVAKPTSWIESDSNIQNFWTRRRPEFNVDYPVLFVANQRKMADGSIVCSIPVKDETTTYIDGGHITTGTIDAARIDVSQISVTSLNGGSNLATKSAAVAAEQYIYYATNNSGVVSQPSSWVTDNTGSSYRWTTKRPKYNRSYPYVFIAKQTKYVSGTVVCTVPVIDDTTTVIDGGHITTGTIDCDRVNVVHMNAASITAGTMSADRISGGTLDFNQITAKNLKVSQTITANDIKTGTLEVGRLTFTNNGRSVRSGRVDYIKSLKFSWHRGNELTIHYSTAMIDGWETVITGTTNLYGYTYDTPIVMLEIGFDCEIEYDTLEFNNGLCVEYSDHTYTVEAPSTRYIEPA